MDNNYSNQNIPGGEQSQYTGNAPYGAPQQAPPPYGTPYTPGRYYAQPPHPATYGNNPYYAGGAGGRYVQELHEKKELRHLSVYTGFAMIGYLVMSYILILILGLFDSGELYDTSYMFSSGFEMIYSVFAIGVPFLLLYANMKKRGYTALNCFGMPDKNSGFICIVLLGFALCLGANYVTYFFADILEGFGVTLPYDSSVPPMDASGVAILFFKTAFVPALVEELAIRGVLLQLMRKYGDSFAIVASSAVFALLHASAIQIPFAFMAGLALGYVYCKTNSIWASILVHFLNNALSCTETVIYEQFSDKTGTAIVTVVTITVFVLGVLSLIRLSRTGRLGRLHASSGVLSGAKQHKVFWFQPTVLISAAIYIISAVSEIETT